MKFLNIDGLSHFLDKTKTWVDNNYYGKDGNISINNSNIKISTSANISSHISSTEFRVTDLSRDNSAYMRSSQICVRLMKGSAMSTMYPDSIQSPKFVKTDGKNTEILLANGDVIALDGAKGVPTLNADGKIDADKVAIDTTLFEVVTELPSTKETIIKNRIYLKASTETDPSGKNIYSEYIYTGDLSTDYDETKWEKLGEYKSEVDLSEYSTKTESVKGLGFSPLKDHIDFVLYYGDNHTYNVTAPLAASEICGFMSSSNYSKLEGIADSATADEALSNNDIDTLFA